MAWEISVSPEWWDTVREVMEKRCTSEFLLAGLVYGELYDQHGPLTSDWPDEAEIDKIRVSIMDGATHDSLVDRCMRMIEAHNTCTNGAHAAYLDPGGWLTVPADMEDGSTIQIEGGSK